MVSINQTKIFIKACEQDLSKSCYIILIFIGDHSLIQYAKRARKIRSIERQIEVTNKPILEAESDLRTLQNPDSLERFAREKYLMHTKNEDVYLVD